MADIVQTVKLLIQVDKTQAQRDLQDIMASVGRMSPKIGGVSYPKGNDANFAETARGLKKSDWNVQGMKAVNTQMDRNNQISRITRHNMLFFGLGLMFFSMSMQKAIDNILQPSLDMAGIMELIGTILGLLFLPAAIALIGPLTGILDIITQIPDEFKLWGGITLMIASVIFGVLSLIGQLVTFGSSVSGVSVGIKTVGGAMDILAGSIGVAGGSTGLLAALAAITVIIALLLLQLGLLKAASTPEGRENLVSSVGEGVAKMAAVTGMTLSTPEGIAKAIASPGGMGVLSAGASDLAGIIGGGLNAAVDSLTGADVEKNYAREFYNNILVDITTKEGKVERVSIGQLMREYPSMTSDQLIKQYVRG